MLNILLASGGLLSIDAGLLISITVTFFIFIGLFAKLAWGPILDALKSRENTIKESLEAAEVALKKAEQISKDNEAALREAEASAQQIRKQAIEDAEKVRESIRQKATEEATKMISDAKDVIEKEKKQALQELQGEVANLAIQATKIILDAELDDKKNANLVDKFIKELSKN